MALFKRKAKNTVLPEVDQYYEGERRDRAGLAWLLALVSVAIVALVLVGAFWGGRWIYREVTKDNQDETVSVVEEGDELPSFDGSTEDEKDESDVDTGRVDAPAQTDTPSTPSETPSAEDEAEDSENLPQTGPGSIAAVFLIASVVAATAHNVSSRLRAFVRH